MQEFYYKLLTPNGNNPRRNRADSLRRVFERLDAKQKDYYGILETGCMRSDHGELCFGDDGCSTFIFDQFIQMMGGEFYSVDINPENVGYARKWAKSEKSFVICKDSVSYLYGIPARVKFDLIYLDSFDITRDNPHPSMLHHLKELCAVLKNTEKGTLIVIDDHDAFLDGQTSKGGYVKDFMKDIKAELVYEGYQIVFQL